MRAGVMTYGSADSRTLDEFGAYNRNSSDDSWEKTRPDEVEEAQQKKLGMTVGRAATIFVAALCVVAVALLVTLEASPSAATFLQNFVTMGAPSSSGTSKSGPSGDTILPSDISVGQDTDTSVTDGKDVESTSDDLSFTFMRYGYDPLIYFTPLDLSIMQYAILEPYIGVMEPSSDMTIEVFGTSDDKYYSFDVCSTTDTSNCQTGYIYTTGNKEDVQVNFACTPLEDEFTVTVSERSSQNDAVLRTSTGYALCMYVRREIRTLTTTDRDSLMDAMYTMWSTNEAIGQVTYGKKFHSSTYLLEFHFFNAAWQDGDHIHEGNGFLHQHIKMSNIFEESIQTVNPSVSLPYWDFTIESAQNISVMLSPIFTPETFGSMPRAFDQYWGWTYRNDSMEAGAIQDSRWAFIKADKNDRYDDLNFAYGYLRAPWNMNPSPYLSRFTSTNKHLPSCSSHYTLLEYDDLSDFLFQSPYAAHAATHGTIGGVYGCDMMDPMMDLGYILDDDGQINLCKNWIFYIKEFYRLNYLVPNQNCTLAYDSNGKEMLDSDSLACGYTCNPDETANFVFELKNILNSDNDCVPYDLQDKGWMAWKDFICQGDGFKIFGGDHLEAASPADPSFWPIHPTLERLLQAKFMAGGFSGDDTWPSDPTNDYVCDKASCYDENYGFGYWDTCCYGHYENDQLMDAAEGDRDAGYGLTNAEVHAYTDPTSYDYNMPYIYADFDWSHCELAGLDFVSLLEEMSVEANMPEEEEEPAAPTEMEAPDSTSVSPFGSTSTTTGTATTGTATTGTTTGTATTGTTGTATTGTTGTASRQQGHVRGVSKDSGDTVLGLDGKRGSATPLWGEYDRSSGMAGVMSSAARGSSASKVTKETNGDKDEEEEDEGKKSKDKTRKSKSKKSSSSKKTSSKKKSSGKKVKSTRKRRTLADEFAELSPKERAQRLRRLKHVTTVHPAVKAAAAAAAAEAEQR